MAASWRFDSGLSRLDGTQGGMSQSITITRVARRTVQAYRAQARLMMSASLGVVAVVGGIENLPIGNSYARLLGALVSLTAIAFFAGVVVQVVANGREGRSKVSVGQAMRTARLTVGELALVLIVASLALVFLLVIADLLFSVLVIAAILGVPAVRHHIFPGIGVGLIVILVWLPCVYLLVSWSLAAPVVVLERPGGLRALGRSRDLVSKSWLRILGALLLLGIFLGAISWASETVGVAVGHDTATVIHLLATILIAPIPIIATAVLYLELQEPASQTATPV